MPDNSGYNLGNALGQLVMGNPQRRQDAFLQGQQAGALVNDRMASARKSRADAMLGEDRLTARQGITPESMTQAGYSPDQAALLGSILRANDSVKLADLGQLAIPQAGAAFQRAADAVNLGDMTVANRNLALAGGKPVETTKITDGTAYDAYADPSQTMHTTALGDATIGARKAQAAASYGQANAANAHARLFDKQTSVGGFNPRAGGDMGSATPLADPNGAHGADYAATLDPTIAAQVKALAEGRMAFPTGTALKSPYWQGMLQHVAQYDPSFDAVNYNARAGTRKAFTSGKEAQTINKLNTVAEHLGLLSDDASALNNTSFQWWNKVKNAAANATGDPSIARFNTARKAAADEVANVWRATGGSMADIEENMKNLDSAQSPEQLNAAIGTLTQLIHGKVSALQDQYRTGMGTTADANRLVSPEAQEAFDKTLERAGVDRTAFDRAAQTTSNTQLGTQVTAPTARPTTQAQFNALPSGAMYIDPDDGKTYRKP